MLRIFERNRSNGYAGKRPQVAYPPFLNLLMFFSVSERQAFWYWKMLESSEKRVLEKTILQENILGYVLINDDIYYKQSWNMYPKGFGGERKAPKKETEHCSFK